MMSKQTFATCHCDASLKSFAPRSSNFPKALDTSKRNVYKTRSTSRNRSAKPGLQVYARKGNASVSSENSAPPHFMESIQKLREDNIVDVYEVGTRYLSLNDSGRDVRELQTFLKKQGYFPSQQECTGFFGPLTQTSVVQWQRNNGIPTTGGFGVHSRAVYLGYLEKVAAGGKKSSDVVHTSTGTSPMLRSYKGGLKGAGTEWLWAFGQWLVVLSLVAGAVHLTRNHLRVTRLQKEQEELLRKDRENQIKRYSSMLHKDRKPDTKEKDKKSEDEV